MDVQESVREIIVRRIRASEEACFQQLMQAHHYLGSLPKIGETLWYVATWRDEWTALLVFSAAAWKCGVRDQWIGWDRRLQYDRLNFVANNSRFLVLPQWHIPNLGSRVLSQCEKKIGTDWPEVFGHPLFLLETFVDPQRFHGTVYRAANWLYVGQTRGFSRVRQGYGPVAQSPKMVFLKPLREGVPKLLSGPFLETNVKAGGSKIMLKAEHMWSLPDFFAHLPDPRRAQGRRHPLRVVLGIAAGAILCGMRGYKAISDWADSLGTKARQRFGCRREEGSYVVPSGYVIRDVLMRVDPAHLDEALQRWNERYGVEDESLAIDGKTMCNAIDDQGRQTHVISAVGHQSKVCYAQKK
jgi:hypothetical protein